MLPGIAVVLVVALSAVGCGGGDPSPAGSPERTTIEGMIIDLRESGGGIEGLTIRSGDADIEVRIDPARDYGFDLRHLHEHVETGDPVRVEAERRGAGLYALSIDDA